jgi:hypothetical protein
MLRLLHGSALLLLLSVLLGCAGSGSLKSESTTAPGADVSSYATFSLQAFGESAGGEQPQSIADANIQNSIRRQLIEKGYREVAEHPDLLVGYQATGYTAEKVTSPVRFGVGLGSFGGPVGVGVDTSVPVGGGKVETTQETRLTIRAVDPKGNKEVWVGTTTGNISQGRDANLVEKAVAGALAKIPDRRK